MTPEQHEWLMTAWRAELKATDYFAVPAWDVTLERPVPLLRWIEDPVITHVVGRIMVRLYDFGVVARDMAKVWNTEPETCWRYIQIGRKRCRLRDMVIAHA